MTRNDRELENLIPADLLQPVASNPPRPPAHDAILDLLAAKPPEMPSAPPSGASDAPDDPSDVFTSAGPPAIFGPGNTGIMSPNSTFPGIAPPNIPGPLGNSPQANSPAPSTGSPPPFVPPSIPNTNETSAPPLSSLPTLDPALGTTPPFLSPSDESVPPTAAAGQTVPNSVRDILPLLPDAAPNSSADAAAPWRQQPGAAAEPSHPAAAAAAGSTGSGNFAERAARPLPELRVSLCEGHRMAKRVLAAMEQKIEAVAREQCKNEIHRSFSVFRADMRANFR